ncbi:MAG: hypothetical protein AAFR27_02385, partial [Pseudomonadota bacterium]
LFYPILIIDLVFLGYHHVISTYTRICFDKSSFREHRFLVIGLLPMVVVATVAIAWLVGIWAIVTIYFYWQWWHYSRQSWGISKAYRAKDRGAYYEDGWLDQAVFYAIPIFGILSRSAEQHETFIFMELWSLPVPQPVTDMSGYIAGALMVYWLLQRVRAAYLGRLAIVHTLYMLTHFAIFYLGYIATSDITFGWLMINIWHNAQYILFVWLYNNKRFKDGVDPDAAFLSYISQNGRLLSYLGACMFITLAIYFVLLQGIDKLLFAGISTTIVLYQIVNFHHYIVDSYIWKLRRPATRNNLGLGQ